MNDKIFEMLNDPKMFDLILQNMTYREKLILAMGVSAFKLSAMKIISSEDNTVKTE